MASSRYWQKKIDVNYKNEICEVFELASQHYFETFFVERSRTGPLHQAIFTILLTVGDFTAEGQGPTKSEAKLQAARQILPDLRRLPLPPEEERPSFWRKRSKNRTGLWQELPIFQPHENPVVCLERLLTNLRGKPAQFITVDVNKETDPFVFTVQLTAADQTVMALGNSKKEAKKNAAAKILNIFGYSFVVSEPEPIPKQGLLDAPETENVPDDVTPREDVCLVPQDISSQPEQESPTEDPELPVPVEGLAQEETSTSADNAQPADRLDLLPADVLPVLAAMGVVQNTDDKVQWCEASPQLEEDTPSVIVEVASIPTPKQVLLDAPETENVPEEVTQGYDVTPREEDVCLVPQDMSSQPEQEVPVPVEGLIQEETSTSADDAPPVPVEGLTQEETSTSADDAPPVPVEGLTQEETSTSADDAPPVPVEGLTQEETSTSADNAQPADLQDLLPADVLPVLAEMGVVQNTDDKVHWCEASPQLEEETPSVIVEVTSEDSNSTEEEEVQMPSVDLVPQQGTEQELDVIQDAPTEDVTPKVNLQLLPAQVLSKLVFMGVITESNGTMEWAELKPSTTCQEDSQDASCPLQTLPNEVQISSVPTAETIETDLATVTNLTTERSEDQREVSPTVDVPPPEANTITTDPEKISAVCGTELRPEALFLTRALVNKVFKMAGSEDCHGRTLTIVRLQREIKDHLVVGGQRKTRQADLEKIGKKAAKDLIVEYGSTDALLRALQEPDSAVLKADVVKHLNIELRAFQNPSKSARFFSILRRVFTCC